MIENICRKGATVQRHSKTRLLKVNGEFTVSIVIANCRKRESGSFRWRIRLGARLKPDITVVVRMNARNCEPLDYYLLPGLAVFSKRILLTEDNPVHLDTYRFRTLDCFFEMAQRARIPEADANRSYSYGDVNLLNNGEGHLVTPKEKGRESLKKHITEQRLLLIVSDLSTFFRDENFLSLLRAEGLDTVPTQLAEKIQITEKAYQGQASQRDLKVAGESHGNQVLNLVLARGYLLRLFANSRIECYLRQHHADLFRELQAVCEGSSLEN